LGAGAAFARQVPQLPDQQPGRDRPDRDKDEDARLPNGKSRSNAIAEEEHKRALDEADQLIQAAQKLKDELNQAGRYVVPVSAVRRTEDIEKLARRIRGRLRS
jgi:hypothetical protein